MSLQVGEPNTVSVGIIGFGEVGQIFVKGLLEKIEQVFVYDVLLEDKHNVLNEKIIQLGARPVYQIEELGHCCDLVLSLVNSAASEIVAEGVAKGLNKKTIFVDLTTSTPQVKSRSEQIVVSRGGIYVDASIMGTVATEQYHVPILIAGDYSSEVQKLLCNLGLNCQAINHPNGAAASIKLLRSIFMKGLEALILETMITAKNYGVSDEVMESISKTINNNDFTTFANALITTHMIHKNRRYKEVLDSCKLIEEAKLIPHVTEGVKSFFSKSIEMEVG